MVRLQSGVYSPFDKKHFMPCARLSYQGSRTVVAVSFLDLLAFMRAEGVKHLKAQNVGSSRGHRKGS